MPPTAHILSTTDGVKVSLDQYGEGRRETAVIICPGFFQSKDTPTFRRMAEALATGQDVIAMDFRGHGRSDGFYTFSAYEGMDLAAVLRWQPNSAPASCATRTATPSARSRPRLPSASRPSSSTSPAPSAA